MEDRRKDFKDKRWQQGCLYITEITSKWSEQRKDKADNEERKCCFVNMSWSDEGKSRIFVYRFKTARACKKAVDKHNLKIAKKYEKEKNYKKKEQKTN